MVKSTFAYCQTLSNSFKTIFKHYSVFFPTLITLLISLLLIPFYLKIIPLGFGTVELSLSLIIGFIGIYIILIIVGLMMHGWTFALIGQIVKSRKTELKKALKDGALIGLRLLMVFLILIALFFIYFVIVILTYMAVIFLSATSLLLTVIVGAIIFITLIAGLILLLPVLPHLVPVLSIEGKGVFRSIAMAFQHFAKNKLHSLAMAVISLALLALSYIPIFLFMLSIGFRDLNMYIIQNPISYFVSSTILGIPMMIAGIWILMFYTQAYVQKK